MSPIEKALRNKTILEWHKALPLIVAGPSKATTRSTLVVEYSKFLGNCPFCEIDPDFTGEDDLDFLWERHSKEIEVWANYNKKA